MEDDGGMIEEEGGGKKEEGCTEGVGGREEEYRGNELERLREALGFFLKF